MHDGANLTSVGSLSTVFWPTPCRQRGFDVSPAAYLPSAPPTVAALGAAVTVAAAIG